MDEVARMLNGLIEAIASRDAKQVAQRVEIWIFWSLMTGDRD